MAKLPRHVAIIMDGNGRWAKKRKLPRFRGHKAGAEVARHIVDYCVKYQIQALTLWAFGVENWRRPRNEVRYLMELFYRTLRKNIQEMHKNSIRLTIIGERDNLSDKINKIIDEAESLTINNSGLRLNIAFNYSGRTDIVTAARRAVDSVKSGDIDVDEIDVDYFGSLLSLSDIPEPDLFIRTSGEVRLSNFMLWQLAYTELYFTDVYWPDFSEEIFERALAYYGTRERRFGGLNE